MAQCGALIIAHTQPQRALLPMGGEALICRMVNACLSAKVSPVFVTVGTADTAVASALSDLSVTLLKAADDADMFSAVCQGIAACPPDVDRLFVSPVCIPPFSASLLRRMRCTRHPVCRPVRGGIGLHPVLLSREAMAQVAGYSGENGLRGALRQFPADAVCRLSVDAEGEIGAFHPEIQVRLANSSPFFGPGPRQLLLGIRARGSVAGACEAIGISYSKGRALLRRMEEALGTELVSRTQGGARGGSAALTADGERFLSRYACYEQAVADYAAAVFSDYFPENTTSASVKTEEDPT